MTNSEILEKELEILENSRKMYYNTIKDMKNNPKCKNLDTVMEEYSKVCERISSINEILTLSNIEGIEPVFLDDYAAALPCDGDTEALAK